MQAAPLKEQPNPNAKVILFTSHGQLQIEIWGRETPLAARNFLQHCMDKYYDNTIFHRMIPGFMIQGGDPTGTGTGGESIYGKPFKDEPHQRLKFTRRGIVAMANCGKDSNGSQFFMTFGQCEHLNKKHTIFGRVIGDTVFNLMSLQSIDTDEQDRPTSPPVIRRTKIILNPFDDMVPRKTLEKQKPIEAKVETPAIKKEQLKKLKKKNKLTFDFDQAEQGSKIKSSHEVLKDSKLSNEAAVRQDQLERKAAEKAEEEEKKRTLKERLVQGEAEGQAENALADQELKKKRRLNQQVEAKIEDDVGNYKTTFNVQTQRTQITWEDMEKKKQEDRQQQLRQAHKKFKQQSEGILADQLTFKKMKEGSHQHKRKMMINQQIELLSNAEKMRYSFLKRREQDKTDNNLFDKLSNFTGKLKDVKDKDKGINWMRHSLKFHIDSQAAYNFDEKKKLIHEGQDDLEDGGLKVQVEKTQPLIKQFNVDQLYDMIHNQDKSREK